MRFLSLCYHYIRKNDNQFPRILGTSENEFIDNIQMLKNNYEMINLDDIINYFYKNSNLISSQKTKMLISFDDGLSDHFQAAKILNKNGISAVFFIPTCIIEDKLPPNPTIIHYTIAKYGISKFLEFFRSSLIKYGILDKISINYKKNKDDPWLVIQEIKNIFKYNLEYSLSRKILLDIYKNSLEKDDSKIFQKMHLTNEQIKLMIGMGHHIGAHTHTHISVASTNLTEDEKFKEFIQPKEILEKLFNISVNSFSYPFGETKDCLSEKDLSNYLKEYKLIFTVNEKLNTTTTSRYELGRYQPISTDTTSILKKKLKKIEMEE